MAAAERSSIRILARVGLLLSIAFVGFSYFSAGADAQTGPTGTIRLEVRYPNGSLVDDTDVCSFAQRTAYGDPSEIPQYTHARFTSVTHALTRSSGAISEVTVPAGELYVAFAYDCSQDGVDLFQTAFNFAPEQAFGNVGSNVRALAGQAVDPGDTLVIPITVGQGTISGTLPGVEFCDVVAIGVADHGDGIERIYGRAGATTSYAMNVPPGQYRVQATCSGQRSNHGSGLAVDGATRLRVGHGQTVSGISFPGPFGGPQFESRILLIDDPSALMPFCINTVQLDGTVVDRSVVAQSFDRDSFQNRGWFQVPDDRQYRVQLTDCFGFGFDDIWYPGVPSAASATVLGPNDNLGRTLPSTIDLLALGGVECNGEPATIIGNQGDNVLTGTSGRDVIVAGRGADEVHGMGGDDVICGGGGKDQIFGDDGADWIDGEAGNDQLGGGRGADVLFGDTGGDTMTGGRGNDILRGAEGKDLMRGQEGHDALRGGRGGDTLIGGRGSDVLRGEKGHDTCNDAGAESRFVGCEVITR